MRRWLNTGLVFLIIFSLFIQPTYGIASPTIQIEVNGTNDLPVKEATVEVFSLNGSILYYLYTNENGTVLFQGEQNQIYTFKITAENYEPVSKNITISPLITENKLKFSLIPLKSLKDAGFLPVFIPALIGFLIFIYWFIRFYRGRLMPYGLESLGFNLSLIMLILSWPSVLTYLLYYNKENILYGGTSFSVFIPIFALIGILSYLLLSIEESFCQNVPKYVKKSISWAYIRRIAIAPYIAILGIYLLPDSTRQNLGSLMLFSFFTGMFTKTIEEWLYKSIQGLLPEELRIRLIERKKYSIENSELVVRLNVEEDVAYRLYGNNIKSVEQLAVSGFDKKYGNEITKEYFDNIVGKANEQIAEIKRLEEILNLTQSESKLITDKAKVYSIKDFANVDFDSINWEVEVATENTKISNIFKQKQTKAKEFAKSEDFKLLSMEDLKKSRDISKEKADYFEILNLHSDINAFGISNWTVEDTQKLLGYQIKTLKDLKTLCDSEGKKNVLEKMKDIPRISDLIEKILLIEV